MRSTDADDPQRHEQQHPGERGMRHARQQIAAEKRQRERERRADEGAGLRNPAGFLCDRRGRRTGVDGKSAGETGQQIRGAAADEVAIDVGAEIGIRDETARRSGGLHHDDDADDQRERRDLAKGGKRKMRDR
jgi:hypothetical protein